MSTPSVKPITLALALSFFGAVFVFSAPLSVVSEDDASQGDYSSGWSSGKNGGSGFGPWNLQTKTGSGPHSHAGFYVANTADKSDLNGIATDGKAFGCFANGTAFEEAAAFRAFDHPLQVGQSFSLQMEHGTFVQKFDADAPGGGSCGVALLPGSASASTAEDYAKDALFEFGYYQAESAYVIHDGNGSQKLDIPFTDAGLSITVTLKTVDTYNLEVTVLAAKHTYHFDDRKLSGIAKDGLGAFCLFDRNGETYDVYFNGFQVLQPP